MRAAYDVDQLLRAGDTGKGQTIVFVESFGSPTIAADLTQFDSRFKLPPPPMLLIEDPLGAKPFDPKVPDMVAWALETSLNVEWAHVVAPGANLVVLTSPVDETQGEAGLDQFADLESYALDRRLGDVISQSWATPESTLESPAGQTIVARFNDIYRRAESEYVTVLSAAGDVPGQVQFPASSPLVTAVGATRLSVSPSSCAYLAEQPWSGTLGGSGGGPSEFFPEPVYQRSHLDAAAAVALDGHRGVPDVAWNGSPSSGVPVFVSFPGSSNGLTLAWGTSLATPEWAGLVADINQLTGHPIGLLNPYLYRLGSNGDVFHSVGQTGAPLWNDLTGWGTPIASKLAEKVAALAHRSGRPAGTTPAVVAGPSAI